MSVVSIYFERFIILTLAYWRQFGFTMTAESATNYCNQIMNLLFLPIVTWSTNNIETWMIQVFVTKTQIYFFLKDKFIVTKFQSCQDSAVMHFTGVKHFLKIQSCTLLNYFPKVYLNFQHFQIISISLHLINFYFNFLLYLINRSISIF